MNIHGGGQVNFAQHVEGREKKKLLQTLFCMGILVLIGFGGASIADGRWSMGAVELVTIVPFVAMLAYVSITARTKLAGWLIVNSIFVLFLYISSAGGYIHTTWAYLIPPISMFFLGKRFGLIYTLSFPSIFGVLLYLGGIEASNFPTDYLARFIGSYLVVGMATYFYEQKRQTFNDWMVLAMNEVDQKMVDLEVQKQRTEEMAKKAEAANQAKSEFLANMSHEIRTPMNGIIGMTELLLETELSTLQRRYAETVRSSGEDLLRVINDILDFSKIEAQKLDLEAIDFSLRELLEDLTLALSLQAHRKGIEFAHVYAAGVPDKIVGDPIRLRQILTNLAGNAIKFTSSGEVAIIVEREEEREAEIRLRFTVRDTGIGIEESKRERLFQAFEQADTSTTREYGGTGLGLAISQQLVRMMEGELRCESELGKGSTFWFAATFGKHGRTTPSIQASTIELEGKRALIIDDNAAIRENLISRLSGWGMCLEESEDTSTALTMLEERANTENAFDIVLVDEHLCGVDGDELCCFLHEDQRFAALRIVHLTSLWRLSRGDDSKKCVDAVLLKPTRTRELKETLLRVLEGPRAEPNSESAIEKMETASLRGLFKGLGLRVLVADDNLTNRQVASGLLQALGVETDTVSNGIEVLAALQVVPYDLLLLDLQMPEMDGLETTRRLRDPATKGVNREMPIIALTAHARQEDKALCLAQGMDGYLSKPLSALTLAHELGRWVPKKPEEGSVGQGAWEQAIEHSCTYDHGALMKRLFNDSELAQHVLESFLEDIPRQIEKLQGSFERGDLREVSALSHRIKGASENVSGLALAQVAAAMETAGRDARQGDVANLMPQLLETYRALRREMRLHAQRLRCHEA